MRVADGSGRWLSDIPWLTLPEGGCLTSQSAWPTVPEGGCLTSLLAELLGQSDDDALRATQEAEPVDVLVLRDLADEFGTVAA
jgi:hypothetical protein